MSEAAPIPELDFDTADRLRKALRFAGVSVQEMAEHLGLSRNSIGRYINGHIEPDRRTLMLWALRCGVPFDWLSGGDDANRSTITRIRGDQLVLNEISAQAKHLDDDAVTELRRSLGHGTRQTNRRVRPAEAQITHSAARS